MEVFVIGILHSFGNDNSKRRMICSCIWKGFVTGILFTFAIYNSNRSSGSRICKYMKH